MFRLHVYFLCKQLFILFIGWGVFIISVSAKDLLVFDAKINPLPSSQGWKAYHSYDGASSSIANDTLIAARISGIGGRAQWGQKLTQDFHQRAKSNGWIMSWNCRIVSGQRITNYYGNGEERFVPALNINSENELYVQFENGETRILATGDDAFKFHQYRVEYDPVTQKSMFLFNGNMIKNNWQSTPSHHDFIIWGNGSSNIDGVADYKYVSFSIKPSIVKTWDLSALSFDGRSQYIQTDELVEQIKNFSEGTIITQFKVGDTRSSRVLFSISNSHEPSSEFALIINPLGFLGVHARKNGKYLHRQWAKNSVADDDWHNVAVSIGQNGTRIFIDGKAVLITSNRHFFEDVSGLNTLNIGRNVDSGGGQWFFDGKMKALTLYDSELSDHELAKMTYKSQILLAYDAIGHKSPMQQNWQNDSSLQGKGQLDFDQGKQAWFANGIIGRAEWQQTPSEELNNLASQNGWVMTSEMRVVSGGYVTNYYSNGQHRFLPIVNLNDDGDLTVHLLGDKMYTLVKKTGNKKYHTHQVVYDPMAKVATYLFDSKKIATWKGTKSKQNNVVWGDGSSKQGKLFGSEIFYRGVSFSVNDAPQKIYSSEVFTGGTREPNARPHYRIPSMVQANNGDLLMFIEGRPSRLDPGNAGLINILLRRSSDQGRSWEVIEQIWGAPKFDYSDPRPVVDKENGNIFIFYTQWEDRCAQNHGCVQPGDPNNIFYRMSSDNGKTWNDPVDITPFVKDPTDYAVNTGPGHGIQLSKQTAEQGGHNGRLIIPMQVKVASKQIYIKSLYSDDHGKTWQVSSLSSYKGPSESDIVELDDGRLLLSSRNGGSPDPKKRLHGISNDGGLTWEKVTHNINITKVDGSIINAIDKEGDSMLLFSAPIGIPEGKNRNLLGIWKSPDNGSIFDPPYKIVHGFSAYSDMQQLNDGSIAVIFEATGSQNIRYLNFMPELLDQ